MQSEAGSRIRDGVFRHIVEAMPEAIVVHFAGRIAFANPAFVRLVGAADHEMLSGAAFINFLAPQSRPRAAERIERASRGLGNPVEHLQFLNGRGGFIDVEVSSTSIDVDGSPATAVIMREISRRIAAEQEARASHDRAELVARATNDVIWDWDLATNEVGWSHSMRELFGWDVERTSLAWWEERIHDDDRAAVSESLQRAVAADEVMWSARYRFRCADGGIVWILDRGYVVRDNGGHATRLIGAMTDVSELHRAHEERASLQAMLEQANRVASLGRVAATIAHEFNNVLMAIQPYAEILRRRATELPGVERPANQIIQAVKRGKRVTDEMLRFTRPADPALSALNLRDFLARLSEQIAELSLPGIDVRIEPPEENVIISADLAQLEQVAMNLIINARDAMPRGGTLTIAAKKHVEIEVGFLSTADASGFACVSFADTGEGIRPDILDRIFEPLFTTKARGGTGLGLAVAQQIVNQHGGYLIVSSTQGVGATFHMLLPRT